MRNLTTIIVAICSLFSSSAFAALENGDEVYMLNDYYNMVLGLSKDGNSPQLSAAGTNSDADSYVMVVETSSSAGFFYLKNKSTGKYLAASTSNSYSIVWQSQRGTGNEFLWKLDIQFGGAIVSKRNTDRRLGCDWSTSDYIGAYYDKQASSRARWSVFKAVEAGYDASLLQAETDEFTNSIGTREKDYFQVAEPITVETAQDVHIISANPFATAGSVDLVAEGAWLIFENVRPSKVISSYLSNVKVKGARAINGSNVRVAIYLDGAAVIPYRPVENVFIGYSEDNNTGEELKLRCQNYTTLNAWNNRMRGFLLKRGFMATVASGTEGSGYSRVYIADHADIVVPVLPEQLNQRISSVNIRRWQYVSKKGWCSTQSNSGIASGAASMKATWFYTWSADRSTTNDCEYVPIRQHLYWPAMSQIEGLKNVTHVLSFNEPEHAEQHTSDKCSCGGVISSWTATTKTPDFATSGLRVGSPAPTDQSYLTEYIGHCDDMAYRCDFVALHSYWGPNEANGASEWYNRLKSVYDATKRPIWITEWAYGASWTTESWPSNYSDQLEKNRAAIMDIVDMLERTPFVERYSYYQWDTSSRRFINDDGWVTPAGKVYRDTRSTFAYNQSVQYIPHWWKPSAKTPTLSFSYDESGANVAVAIGNTNGDITASLVLQRKCGDGEWQNFYEVEERADFDNSTIEVLIPVSDFDRSNDKFRVLSTTLFGAEADSEEAAFGFITNPDCVFETTGWTVKELSVDNGESFDGDASNKYWNQWKASGLNSSMTQTLTNLPAGEYVLSALLRGGTNVTLELKAEVLDAEGNATDMAPVTASAQGKSNASADGDEWKNGWMTFTLSPVTITTGQQLRITATGKGSGSAWWSADHFTLEFTPAVGIDAVRSDATNSSANDVIYDLNGRRLDSDATHHNIIIRNGKKTIIK